MTNDDLLKEAREAWSYALERDRENRDAAEDDIRFARLEEQWSADDRQKRESTGRPCLTINRLAPIGQPPRGDPVSLLVHGGL